MPKHFRLYFVFSEQKHISHHVFDLTTKLFFHRIKPSKIIFFKFSISHCKVRTLAQPHVVKESISINSLQFKVSPDKVTKMHSFAFVFNDCQSFSWQLIFANKFLIFRTFVRIVVQQINCFSYFLI